MATKPAKSDWLSRSKMTHGDGNVGVAKANTKAKTGDKAPAVFGNKSGGGAGPAGGGKVMMVKGLMQKGK